MPCTHYVSGQVSVEENTCSITGYVYHHSPLSGVDPGVNAGPLFPPPPSPSRERMTAISNLRMCTM